jgi:RNA polymerase sigma factor (sigma-70 family)
LESRAGSIEITYAKRARRPLLLKSPENKPADRPIVEETSNQTNQMLVGWMQEYLRTMLARQTPDSLLVMAWDEFYRIYDSLLRRFAAARGLNGSDLDDCVQAVWMKVSLRLSEFERPENRPGLRAWLYTLVRSESYDVLNRRIRSREQSPNAEREAGYEPIDQGADPQLVLEKEWERTFLGILLTDIRDEISETNCQLLTLRFQDGLEAIQIATELNLSPEEVRYRQHRLLKKLRKRAAVLTGDAFPTAKTRHKKAT